MLELSSVNLEASQLSEQTSENVFIVLKENVQTVFRSVYNFKMDHNLRRDAREKCPRRRPDQLIQIYKRIKDNLPAEIRTLSMLTYLDFLGKL